MYLYHLEVLSFMDLKEILKENIPEGTNKPGFIISGAYRAIGDYLKNDSYLCSSLLFKTLIELEKENFIRPFKPIKKSKVYYTSRIKGKINNEEPIIAKSMDKIILDVFSKKYPGMHKAIETAFENNGFNLKVGMDSPQFGNPYSISFRMPIYGKNPDKLADIFLEKILLEEANPFYFISVRDVHLPSDHKIHKAAVSLLKRNISSSTDDRSLIKRGIHDAIAEYLKSNDHVSSFFFVDPLKTIENEGYAKNVSYKKNAFYCSLFLLS